MLKLRVSRKASENELKGNIIFGQIYTWVTPHFCQRLPSLASGTRAARISRIVWIKGNGIYSIPNYVRAHARKFKFPANRSSRESKKEIDAQLSYVPDWVFDPIPPIVACVSSLDPALFGVFVNPGWIAGSDTIRTKNDLLCSKVAFLFFSRMSASSSITSW